MTGLNILKLLVAYLIFTSLIGCVNRYVGPNPNIVNKFDLNTNELLLVVKVNRTTWTGLYPSSSQCSEGFDCIPMSFWYTHEAKVLDVINGKYDEQIIKFAILSHADYLKEIKKEWYVQLKPFENKQITNEIGALYYIENHSSKYSISQ